MEKTLFCQVMYKCHILVKLGSATLSQLAFLGKMTQSSYGKNSSWDNTLYIIQNTSIILKVCVAGVYNANLIFSHFIRTILLLLAVN